MRAGKLAPLVGVLLGACPVRAVVVDFENVALAEGTLVTTIPGVPEIALVNARLVVPGNPYVGFNGNSTGSGAGGIDHAASGKSVALPGLSASTLRVTFSVPVTSLTFEALDLDVPTTFVETVIGRVYDAPTGGSLLQSITISGGDPGTGDGIRTLFDLSAAMGVRRLEIQGSASPGTVPGKGFDNISFTTEPVVSVDPASWGGMKDLHRR